MKNIIIAGAGFAGLRAAQDLGSGLQQLGIEGFNVILVDQSDTHLYRADLYEVATAFNEEINEECLTELKETVATPIKKLIDGRNIEFVRAGIEEIRPKERLVVLANGSKLSYEYLVVALGSVTNYFGIPGLQEFGFPLKTIQDALAINCHLDQYFRTLWKSGEKRTVSIVVGGGGASGVETAAELVHSLDRLCHKYGYHRGNVKIKLVEAGMSLAALDEVGTQLILDKFAKQGIEVHLGNRITSVNEKEIEVSDAEKRLGKLEADMVIWTGGVMVNPVVSAALGNAEKGGAVVVDEFLESVKFEGVYAAGDNVFFEDTANVGKRLPMLATTACRQGACVAHNILVDFCDDVKEPYIHKEAPYMVPVGGRHVVWKKDGKMLAGRWIWLLRRLLTLRYFASILPFGAALKNWLHGNKIFAKND